MPKRGWKPVHSDSVVKDLNALADRINERERKAVENVLFHAKTQGDDLIEARARVGPRKFAPWLRGNFKFSRQTAYAYIRVAENWEAISKGALPISLMGALRVLAAYVDGEPGDPGPPHDPGPAPEKAEARPRPPLVVEDDRTPLVRLYLTGEPRDVPDDAPLTHDSYDPDKVVGAGELRGKNVNIYRPDGSLLLAYRPRALSAEICRVAHPGFRRAARRSEHRGGVESGTVGFYDDPRPRPAAFTRDYPGDWARMLPFMRAVDRVFRRELPGPYAHQLKAVAETDPRRVIGGTVFTTGTVNRNVEFKPHLDANNLPGSLAALAVFRAGFYSGGLLCFPCWGVAVDLRTRDVLLADTVTEPHGVTPFVPDDPWAAYERVSVVLYFRAGLANLPRPPVTPVVRALEESFGRRTDDPHASLLPGV